jgi:hypothetical protein
MNKLFSVLQIYGSKIENIIVPRTDDEVLIQLSLDLREQKSLENND